ncbi:ABC transporter permease subunit [Candidatus Roizmanbacteria bacterium]|nr:ABC transporter permease subunit [Candidatus Roizmanbacteria bacterium]
MLNLYKKELQYYLNNPIGYIIIGLFAVFANFLFIKDIFVIGSASMRPFFTVIPWLLLIFIPALTMRIISEERRANTVEVLLTLPISETQVVLSKFFALCTLMVISLVLTMGIPISLFFLTKLYFPEIFAGYFGSLLLAAGFIGISMLFSSLTKNQVVAFLTSIITLFILLVLGTDFMGGILPRMILDFLTYFTPQYHFQNFVKGVFDKERLLFLIFYCRRFLLYDMMPLSVRHIHFLRQQKKFLRMLTM